LVLVWVARVLDAAAAARAAKVSPITAK